MSVEDSRRAERAVAMAALLVLAASLLLLALLALADPSRARGVLLQWSAQILLGKETGIPAGMAAGAPPWLIVLAGFAQDVLILLAGYALALRAARGALRMRWLQRRLPQPRPRGASRRGEPLGVALLALTLGIPFLPTGALVAAIGGRALGYRTRVLLPALAASVLLSHVAYTMIFTRALGGVDPRVLLVAAALASAATGLVYARASKARDEARPPDEIA